MKKIFYCLSFGLAFSKAISQTFDWTSIENLGNPDEQHLESMGIDKYGNSYLSIRNHPNCFIVKIGNDGVLKWRQSLNVSFYPPHIKISVDSIGNCYLIGGVYDYSLTLGSITLNSGKESTH